MMTQSKNHPETPDYGTEIRLQRGEVVVYGKHARVRGDALRIDQLLSRGVIDEMQHLECFKLRVHWIGGGRHPLRSMQLREHVGTLRGDDDMVSRLSHQDKYFFLMSSLQNFNAKLLYAVVLEEQPLRAAWREIAVKTRNGNERQALHHAIDDLVNAFDALYDFENPKKSTVAKSHLAGD